MINNIAIAGAGISGMSTAFALTSRGYRVTIYAHSFSPDITSNKAAAFWFPYHIRNDKRGIEWCDTSFRQYVAFAGDKEAGISMHPLVKVLRKGVVEEAPLWLDFLPAGGVKVLPGEAVAPGLEKAYSVEVPLIETQLFLPWLQEQLLKRGVEFIQKELNDLHELSTSYDLVINCTGLGARLLCNDKTVVPVRGQVALLAPGPKLPIYLDNEKPLYIVPRQDAIIIGGTFEEGLESQVTEPATIARILSNAYEVFPVLKEQTVIGSWAGLRPYRPEVRVEKEADSNIIHNYGHGGSGFTLAFGCAETVAAMAAM